MMANVSVGQLFLAGIIPGVVMAILMMLTVAYYAHKYKWGGDVKFEWARIGKALVELAVVIGFPLAMWGCDRAGLPFNCAFGLGLAAAVPRRLELQVRCGDADHDAGAADRRHDDGRVHADRRRDRRVRLGAGPRASSGTGR